MPHTTGTVHFSTNDFEEGTVSRQLGAKQDNIGPQQEE